jgi:hypothetical protein
VWCLRSRANVCDRQRKKSRNSLFIVATFIFGENE